LKGQLKEARRRLATVPVASDNEFIDLSSISTTTAPDSDSNGVTELERNLKAEQCVRQDVEMHVITLHSHRSMNCAMHAWVMYVFIIIMLICLLYSVSTARIRGCLSATKIR